MCESDQGWHTFTLDKSVSVICNWVFKERNLTRRFIIKATSGDLTTKSPPKPPTRVTSHTTTPSLNWENTHNRTFAGPYVIRQSKEQKLLLDPTHSLKKVHINIQRNISHLQKDCQPYVQQSLKGWNAWLAARSHNKIQRDVAGWFGTGLGVLNTTDQEVLVHKLSALTPDLGKLKIPLTTSLLTLAETQSLAVKLLPLVATHTAADLTKTADYPGGINKKVALAVQCIQTQQWVQTVAAGIFREGPSGILPQERREITARNRSTTQFEKNHQAWWQFVNFTYNSQHQQIEAYGLTQCSQGTNH